MKKIYLVLVLFSSLVSIAQFNDKAPWKVNNLNKKTTNFNSEVATFNNYWLSHDPTKKGSGYKPFKRWEYQWQNQLNDDGTIMTPQQLWEVWQQKQAQKLNKNSILTIPTSNWQPIGPFTHTNTGSWSSGQGRVAVVAIDPSNTNTLYVGAPAGGIWKSTNSGSTWTPLSDELPQIGVSGIAVDHSNSNTIYIATGDKDANVTYSVGVLKSTNGGITWNTTGLSFAGTNNLAGDIIMHPTNNQILLCATSAGLYRTTNGGVNWIVEQTGDFSQGSVRFKPGDPTIVYATTSNRFYKSTNTGDTFTNITSGLSTAANTTRMILDITPANGNYVYVLSINGANPNGVYKSTNSGTSFTKTSGTTNFLESNQGWYDLALAVSNTNPDLVFTGCLNVWKSTSGGGSITKINEWNNPTGASYTHADIHFLQYINGKLYCGSDGGVYVSTDDGNSFTDLTAGLQISMFYKVSVAKQTASKMVGGLQDNGGHAFSNNNWKNYYGADGMDAAVSQVNSNLFYGFIQSGGGLYISNNGGSSLSGSVNAPSGASGNWVTPLKGDSQGNIYAGYNNLYKLVNGAWVQQNINSVGSGSLEEIAIAPSDDNLILVSNGASLYKSTNAGVNFSLIYTASAEITGIAIHSTNTNIIYITTSGTTGNAFKSINGGTSFTVISTGLPAISKNCIVHQARHSENPLFVGTSLGVYYFDDNESTWQPFDTNLPNVSVRDLEINLEDAKIIAATYGRGIWQSDIPVQIPITDIKFLSVNNPTLNIPCNSTVSPEIVVKNGGSSTINSVTVNYLIDGNANNYTWTGTIAPNTSQNITIPSFVSSRGSHNLSFTVTTNNDAYNDNNSGSTSFYINDSGTVGTTNTFSNNADELIVITEGGSGWQRANRTGVALNTNGNSAYVTSTTGNYNDLVKSSLVSQCYNLSNVINPTINFKLAFDLEENWDIAYVEYTTNFGASWQVLGALGANWYNSDRTPATTGNDCNNCVGAQWTGTNTTLTTYSYPLNALNSETNIIFRIVFHSDESANQEGAIVDDFVISGTLANESFELEQIGIYPNPSSAIFNIYHDNIVIKKIEVYDLTGKTIVSQNYNNNSNLTQLNLSNISEGVYFVKISSENSNIVKRIIKK